MARSSHLARLPSLDGWRALAILMVLGSHHEYATGTSESGDWLSHVCSGDLGVRFFFVLSGFLISLLIIREIEDTGAFDLRRFFLRRAIRLLPVYFTYLGVLGLLSGADLYHDATSSWIGCLTFTRNIVGRGDSATVHFWSLAVEEQFYLLWPSAFAAFSLWKKPRVRYVSLLATLVLLCPLLRWLAPPTPEVLGLGDRLLTPRSILFHADSLAIGCLGAWWFACRGQHPPWRKHSQYLALFALAVIAGGRGMEFLDFSHAKILPAIIPTVQAVAMVTSIILSLHPRYPLHWMLNRPSIIKIGVLSYSLYVWHFLFLGEFIKNPMASWPTHDWRVWWIPSLLVAWVSHRCLEQPLLKWRRKLGH